MEEILYILFTNFSEWFKIQDDYSESMIEKWFVCIADNYHKIFLQFYWQFYPIRLEQTICDSIEIFSCRFTEKAITKDVEHTNYKSTKKHDSIRINVAKFLELSYKIALQLDKHVYLFTISMRNVLSANPIILHVRKPAI